MTSPVAGLFPGQGSQTADLRELVARAEPELLEQCTVLVGEDPFPRVAESTRYAQPAIFCASIAGWMQARDRVAPVVLAGHSLGELSALVAAGALEVLDGLKLAVRRGALMDEASAGEQEGMLAVLGAERDQVTALASQHDVLLANDNAPGQVVLAGPVARLREASKTARELGVRAVLLDVAGAFHTPAMAAAVEPFLATLDEVPLREPSVPVISGASAQPFSDIKRELAQAILRPVRWRETMLALARMGAGTFVEFGPGTVLARLVARNLPDAEVIELTEHTEASGVA